MIIVAASGSEGNSKGSSEFHHSPNPVEHAVMAKTFV